MSTDQTVSPEQVAEAFRKSGRGWILDLHDATDILRRTASDIDELIRCHQERFGETPDPFALLGQSEHKGQAFFQALVGQPLALDMRVMIYRILVGDTIAAIRLDYGLEQSFELIVTLRMNPGREEIYRTDILWDFRLLRHIGILGVGDKTILDGFFAFAH